MASGDIKFDRDKLKAAILHVIKSCEADDLGAVKLHKVMYYSDMLYFLVSGRAITGAEYRKRPFGPTCDDVLRILNELQNEDQISVERVNYFGYWKNQYHLHTDPDTNHLAKHEIDVIDEIIDFVCKNQTAQTISEFSHDMVWDMVEFGDVIPYHNAIHLIPNDISLEAADWAQTAVEDFESKRPKSSDSKVESRDAGAFRASLVQLSQS